MRHPVSLDRPPQERPQRCFVGGGGVRHPPVQVGLAAAGQGQVPLREVAQKLGCHPKVTPGALVAVVPDRAGGCGGAEPPQQMPAAVMVQDFAVLDVRNDVQPAGQPLFEEEQEPVHRRENPGGDKQVADMDHRPPWGQGCDPLVGQRHLVVGECLQDRWHVRFGQPQNAGSGSGHAHDQVMKRPQFSTDVAGAVVEGVAEPVGQDAAAAHALVMLPAFLAAAGAGEVTDPTGAVGAAALAGGPDPGQQPVDAAAVADSVGLAGLREAARADPSLRPAPDRHPYPAPRIRWCGFLVGDPQRPTAPGAAQPVRFDRRGSVASRAEI